MIGLLIFAAVFFICVTNDQKSFHFRSNFAPKSLIKTVLFFKLQNNDAVVVAVTPVVADHRWFIGLDGIKVALDETPECIPSHAYTRLGIQSCFDKGPTQPNVLIYGKVRRTRSGSCWRHWRQRPSTTTTSCLDCSCGFGFLCSPCHGGRQRRYYVK